MADITLIGLGAMGSAIARVLLKNSCDLLVWNCSTDKRDLETGRYEEAIAAMISPSPFSDPSNERMFLCEN